MTSSTSQFPVFISGEVARKVFRWEDAISAIQATYALPLNERSVPARTIAESDKTWLRCLSAIPAGGRYYGAKLMGMHVSENTKGLEYVIVLFDRETCRIAAFIDANAVTGLRTAATTAAALDKLAPLGSAKLAVLGSGLEASMHVRAFASIRPISEVVVYSPTQSKREAFAEAVTCDLGIPARAVEHAQDAVTDADIVLSAARSHDEQPILFADWLKPAVTVISIGSTVPEQREIDVSVVERSDLIVGDMLEEVLEHTGDMLAAQAAGLSFYDKAISLADLIAGRHADRIQAAKNRMYKSVGGGLQDIVVAEVILTKALEAGLVTALPIQFETKF
ncbi:ornithine cyclodeaminase family protein [Acinetobacter baumannii]|nr:ornithine cyclodeaminase family protein [Acinetobacter baumannii]